MGWGIGGSLGVILLMIAATLGACDRQDAQEEPVAAISPSQPPEATPILVDGSSTVHLLSESVLDLYASKLTTDVHLEVSGTGGGFKKFCSGETHINGASRPISSPEAKLCSENGVEFVELPVAYDGIAVVVPKSNEFLHSLTKDELSKLWSQNSEGVTHSFSQIRASLPDEEVHLYGPGIESGTFDFFNEAILGDSMSSRADYKSSENDNELATLIAKDPGGLGYFGLAYYRRYKEQLRLVAIDDQNDENGEGPILPTAATVGGGQYAPLSRPLFIYVERGQLDRAEVQGFVQFYLKSARLVAPDVGYIGLGQDVLSLATARLNGRKLGSVFSGVHSVVGLTIADLLQAEEEPVAASAK